MKPGLLARNIDEFLADGFAEDIFLAIQGHVAKEAGGKWELGPYFYSGMISEGGISIEDYIRILDSNSYSAVFFDGSVIILQARFDEQNISSHRYFYIPCPVDRNAVIGRPPDVMLSDWLKEYLDEEGIAGFRSVGTYRFDFIELEEPPKEPHPISHLTFASPGCRIPVKSPLSPSLFIDFVFYNFYFSIWGFYKKYRDQLICLGLDESISAEERERLHLHYQ